MQRLLLSLGFFCALQLASPDAGARVAQDTHYTKSQTFQSALRFLRIDQGFQITEKDVESGYLLFEYTTTGSDTKSNGSIEVIEKEEGVTLVVQLPQMPEHHERYLADGLLSKLRSEYGEPPKKKKESKKARDKAKEDAPKDDDEPTDKPKDDDAPREDAPSKSERPRGYKIK